MAHSTEARVRSVPEVLALIIGATYLLVGLLGFLVTGFAEFAGVTGKTLLIFEINPLHNLVHIVIGAAGLFLGLRPLTARLYGAMLFLGYGATFIYGLVAVGRPAINVLSLNDADNVLHGLSALGGLVVAGLPASSRVSRR